MLRKDPDGSKELHLDLADNEAFSIFSGDDGLTRFKAGQGNSEVVTAGKWYRIARCTGSGRRTNAVFNLADTTTGGHNNLTFRTGMAFNNRSLMSFTLLSNSAFGNTTFSDVRYLSGGSPFNDFYLEIKIARNALVSYSIMENIAEGGWEPVDWVETTEIPGGYTDTNYNLMNKLFMVAGETPVLTVDRTDGGSVIINGPVILNTISGDIPTYQQP